VGGVKPRDNYSRPNFVFDPLFWVFDSLASAFAHVTS
jgi:hypothetical protein